MFATENSVPPNKYWTGKQNSFAWLAVASAQTKLDSCPKRRKKLSGKTRNPVVNSRILDSYNVWVLTQQFGLRGRQEHHRMRLEDFRIMKGDDGLKVIEFAEGLTKTRPGGLYTKPRQFQPKMFQTGEKRCPVALFHQYISCRPPHLRTSGPLIFFSR